MIEPNVGESLAAKPLVDVWTPVRRFVGRRWRVLQAWRARTSEALTLQWASRYAKLDPNAKCPGCGARRGHIYSSRRRRQMVHTCHQCRAKWGEPFLVNPDLWMGR